MKAFYLVIIVFLHSVTVAQTEHNQDCCSLFDFGLYLGANSESADEVGSNYSIIFKTNISQKLKLNLITSFIQVFKDESYFVRSSSNVPLEIEGISLFHASEYIIDRVDYDIFAFSLALQYSIIKMDKFEPYLLLAPHYNYFSSIKTQISNSKSWSYKSYDEIPDQFKHEIERVYPSESFGLSFGVGNTYSISKSLYLDLRYFYKLDSEIINTHNVLIGINF